MKKFIGFFFLLIIMKLMKLIISSLKKTKLLNCLKIKWLSLIHQLFKINCWISAAIHGKYRNNLSNFCHRRMYKNVCYKVSLDCNSQESDGKAKLVYPKLHSGDQLLRKDLAQNRVKNQSKIEKNDWKKNDWQKKAKT